jgi:hypothetical protein
VNCGVKKGVKAKGWDSCYQPRDQGGWKFVTTSKELALQVKRDYYIDAWDSLRKIACTYIE